MSKWVNLCLTSTGMSIALDFEASSGPSWFYKRHYANLAAINFKIIKWKPNSVFKINCAQ